MAWPLLPSDIADRIPDILRGPGYGKKSMAYVKLVASWQDRRWYVSLYDPKDQLCWTKYVGPEGAALMGIHLATLEGMRGPNGERVERDDSFLPCPLADCEPESVPFSTRSEESL